MSEWLKNKHSHRRASSQKEIATEAPWHCWKLFCLFWPYSMKMLLWWWCKVITQKMQWQEVGEKCVSFLWHNFCYLSRTCLVLKSDSWTFYNLTFCCMFSRMLCSDLRIKISIFSFVKYGSMENHYLFFALSLSVSLFMQLSKSFIQARKSRRS